MKKLLTTLAYILFSSAAIAARQPYQFTISIKAPSDVKLYLAYQTNGKKYLDSAVQKNGIYAFKGTVEKPVRGTLVLDYDHAGIQRLMKQRSPVPDLLQFYIHPGKFSIYSSSLMSESKFTGSIINSDNRLLQNELASITAQERKNGQQIMTERDVTKIPDLESKADSLKQIRRAILKRFIKAHPKSYIALTSLQEYMSAVDPETESLFKKLSPEVRATLLGLEISKIIADQKSLKPGAFAPDFAQPDVNGKPVKLSDFRGQYILLDFWASWCGPCRVQAPELVKTYTQFKNRNFTILGISLDELDGKEKWKKAIKDDGLSWTQVADLRHWDNKVVKLYSIRAIPETILIDPAGKIIARGIAGDDLNKKLEEILPK